MTDTQNNVNPETLSTNFFYTVGKEETFNCQFTVRGNPSPNDIASHIEAAISAMKAVVAKGGHAKQVGGQSPSAKPNGASGDWDFKPKNSKTYIVAKDGELPESIACPIHDGKTLKLRTGQHGPYLSHKDGSGWCNIGEWRS